MARKRGGRSARGASSIEELAPASGDRARLTRENERLLRENERLEAARQAAEAVRDEFMDLYELGPLPALTLNAGYTVRRANRAMLELVGLDSNAFLKQSFRRFLAQEDRHLLSTHLAKAAKGSLERCRLRLALSEGPPITVELWTRALARTGFYEIRVVDLREQEQAELDARLLAESERAARDQNAAKDAFIAMLSHELRAPLTPALAAASRFGGETLSPPLAKAFAVIQRGILAEVRMIDDLLDVNRVLRGKMSVTCKVASVHDIVRDAAGALLKDAEAKGQALELALDAERYFADIDALRLRQVFWNLLRNAIKFTGENGHISVRSWNNEQHLAVEVADDGVGITAADLERVFLPFDQLDRGGKTGGLGLGLAISRGLIELQRGTLAAQSGGPSRGSRFVVNLETVAAPAEEANMASTLGVEAPRASPGGPLRILLVEDDPDTIEIMVEILEESGFHVRQAESAAEAKRVDLEEIDLIVCDLGLPDQSGLDLIRTLQSRRRRPALALSGFGMEADVKASHEAGFDEHLAKPVDVKVLLETLRRLALGTGKP